MIKYKRDYFEEMNIDYEELKDYKDVETYYDEIQDFTNLLKELQCDRVECQKYIVRVNKENEILNNIINKLEQYLIDSGVDDEILECCDIYDVNGIELRKIIESFRRVK